MPASPEEKILPSRRRPWVLLSLLLCVVTFGGSQYYLMWREARGLRKRMVKARRVLSIEECAIRCRQGKGFLIAETMAGWPVGRLWWSDDTAFIDTLEDPWSLAARPANVANYRKFLEPADGVALLVCPFAFLRGLRRLIRKRFAGLDVKWIDSFWAEACVEEDDATT